MMARFAATVHGHIERTLRPAGLAGDEIPGAQLVMVDELSQVTAPASFPTIVPGRQ